MNTLFGIPMTTIMVALLAVLALVLLATVYVAVRNPVIFRLGIRNVPRRKAQTALIVVGLMLSTLVISAALTTGDTVSYSMGDTVYRSLGRVDEVIRPGQDPYYAHFCRVNFDGTGLTSSDIGTDIFSSSPICAKESRGSKGTAAIRLIPKPFSVGGVTNGPSRSVHENCNVGSSVVTSHCTSTRPVDTESAPYFAALSTSS